MFNFIVGIIIGIFLIPIIKEIQYQLDFYTIKMILKEPMDILRGILDRTFHSM